MYFLQKNKNQLPFVPFQQHNLSQIEANLNTELQLLFVTFLILTLSIDYIHNVTSKFINTVGPIVPAYY